MCRYIDNTFRFNFTRHAGYIIIGGTIGKKIILHEKKLR